MIKRSAGIIVLLGASFLLQGQTRPGPDACALLPVAQLNSMLGVALKDAPSIMKGKRCTRRSADAKSGVTIEWTAFSSPASAQNMLKMNFDSASAVIAKGQKAVGIYASIHPLATAGGAAHYLTGPGNDYSGRDLVRLQFVLNERLVTVDTNGIAPARVAGKLDAIFRTIKQNAGR